MVNAILYQARTGCQWRYLPGHFGPWGAIWQQFRRWRAKGVWEKALTLLRMAARTKAGRDPEPSMVMLDCQTVKGGRGGARVPRGRRQVRRHLLLQRTVLIDYLGLPVAARVDSARPHDSKTRRCSSIIPFPVCLGSARCSPTSGSSRWSRAFSAATRSRSPPKGGASRTSPRASSPSDRCGRSRGCFAQLGRWRRLSRSYEATTESATTESATTWLHVACVGYLLTKL